MTDIDAFFAEYADRYMASDVDAIGALYEAPFLAVREGRAIHLPDDAAVRAHLTQLMDAYKRAGAARAEIADLDVLPLGRSSVMATVRWNVRDSAGELVRDFFTTYQLLRGDAGWRILAYTNHDT